MLIQGTDENSYQKLSKEKMYSHLKLIYTMEAAI